MSTGTPKDISQIPKRQSKQHPAHQKPVFPYTFKSDEKDEIDDRLIVLKIGSSSLSNTDGTIRLSVLSQFVETVYKLTTLGYRIAIVSSGAVSVGCNRLNLKERPTDTISKQACAAVGQSKLMRLYDDLFSIFNIPVAQVLLTRDNVAQEEHYLNAVNTIRKLLSMNIVTIINENDTVSVFELKVGDNDTLSAMVASMIKAKWLFLITDVDALYTANPHTDPSATPLRVIDDIPRLMKSQVVADTPPAPAVSDHQQNPSQPSQPTQPTTARSGAWGTGGMQTKLTAALMASHAGVTTGIVSFLNLDHIGQIIDGDRSVGTVFMPSLTVLSGRKKWLSIAIIPSGAIVVDDGAHHALRNSSSLFASGITRVEGTFAKGACVGIYAAVTPETDANTSSLRVLTEIGRGIVSYSSEELDLIKGTQSRDALAILVKYYRDNPDRLDGGSTAMFSLISNTIPHPHHSPSHMHSTPCTHLTKERDGGDNNNGHHVVESSAITSSILDHLGCVISRHNLAIYSKSKDSNER